MIFNVVILQMTGRSCRQLTMQRRPFVPHVHEKHGPIGRDEVFVHLLPVMLQGGDLIDSVMGSVKDFAR